MSISSRLKEERERLNLSQTAFASAAGVTKRTMIDWEKGTTSPPTVKLSSLSIINADVTYILTGNRANESKPEEEKPDPAVHDLIMVPRYDIQASAGNGVIIHSELIVDHLAFKQTWVRERGLNPKCLALIEVRGDSMEPTLRNRDLVLINTAVNRVSADGIYAIQLNGFLMTKRIQALMDGTVAVMSDNTTYRHQILQAEELHSLHIIGEVIWFGRDM